MDGLRSLSEGAPVPELLVVPLSNGVCPLQAGIWRGRWLMWGQVHACLWWFFLLSP